MGLSHSKNFLADRRKKGKSSYYKKVADVSNNSEAFFSQLAPSQKDMNKMSCPSETQSLEPVENEPEEIHYHMVDFQQKCKKMIIN